MNQQDPLSSRQESVADQQEAITNEGKEAIANEKQVPVSEAIRYRKRAQAAEKELNELKQSHQQQTEELAALKEQIELIRAESVSDRLPHSTALMTQGVKEPRTGGARTSLQNAARQAASSGSRADVHEYLRLRRNYL